MSSNWSVQILDFDVNNSPYTAYIGTTDTILKIIGSGLQPGDAFVNASVRQDTALSNPVGFAPLETGSRTVSAVNNVAGVDEINFYGLAVYNQAVGNDINLYRYVDHTDLLKTQTLRLNKKLEGKSNVSFTFNLDGVYWPRAGMYVKIIDLTGNIVMFIGFIKNISYKRYAENTEFKLEAQISCESLNAIAQRRTIQINYTPTIPTIAIPDPPGISMGSIVIDFVSKYLSQDYVNAFSRTLTADTGTTATTIVTTTPHGQQAGWQIYNATQQAYGEIASVISATSFTLNYAITGQASTDLIRVFDGYIHSGAYLTDDWVDDFISISDALNQCAANSGYQWFVDDKGFMNFWQDAQSSIVASSYPEVYSGPDIPLSPNNVMDGGIFKDYKKVEISESTDGYANKLFMCGGNDSQGNAVLISTDNFTEIHQRQLTQGGTGVYGSVVRDSSISEADYEIAGAGTTTTNINIVGHGQEVGWMVLNVSRGFKGVISNIVDPDNFTIIDAIPLQTSGDTIVLFNGANTIIANSLKKQNVLTNRIKFETQDLSFLPGMQITIALSSLNITYSKYLIESVDFFDVDGKHIFATVNCILRDSSNFSTQRPMNYIDDFGMF